MQKTKQKTTTEECGGDEKKDGVKTIANGGTKKVLWVGGIGEKK